jgi:hypothetical protein
MRRLVAISASTCEREAPSADLYISFVFETILDPNSMNCATLDATDNAESPSRPWQECNEI